MPTFATASGAALVLHKHQQTAGLSCVVVCTDGRVEGTAGGGEGGGNAIVFRGGCCQGGHQGFRISPPEYTIQNVCGDRRYGL